MFVQFIVSFFGALFLSVPATMFVVAVYALLVGVPTGLLRERIKRNSSDLLTREVLDRMFYIQHPALYWARFVGCGFIGLYFVTMHVIGMVIIFRSDLPILLF